MPNDLYILLKVPYDRIDNPLKAFQDHGIFQNLEEAIVYGITIMVRDDLAAYVQIARLDVVAREIILEHVVDYNSEQKWIIITNEQRLDDELHATTLSIKDALARAGYKADKYLRDDIQEYLDVPNHTYKVGDTVYLPFYELRFWKNCGPHTPFKVIETRPRRLLISPQIKGGRIDWVAAPYVRTEPDERS